MGKKPDAPPRVDTVGEFPKQRTYAFYPIEFKELTQPRLNSPTVSAPQGHICSGIKIKFTWKNFDKSEFRINYISDLAVIQPASQRRDPKKSVLFPLPFGALQDQGSFQLPYEGRHQRSKAKQIAE
jgi:hypothetical protein